MSDNKNQKSSTSKSPTSKNSTNPNSENFKNEETMSEKNNPKTKNSEPSQSGITKLVLLFIFLAGVAMLGDFVYEKIVPDNGKLEMQSLPPKPHFVSQDIIDLYHSGKIPNYFGSIKTIKWSYYDEELKKQIPEKSLPFKTTPVGNYDLEVDAFSSPQKDSKIVVLQMNLIDNRTKNKVYELSRNYEIKNEKLETKTK